MEFVQYNNYWGRKNRRQKWERWKTTERKREKRDYNTVPMCIRGQVSKNEKWTQKYEEKVVHCAVVNSLSSSKCCAMYVCWYLWIYERSAKSNMNAWPTTANLINGAHRMKINSNKRHDWSEWKMKIYASHKENPRHRIFLEGKWVFTVLSFALADGLSSFVSVWACAWCVESKVSFLRSFAND